MEGETRTPVHRKPKKKNGCALFFIIFTVLLLVVGTISVFLVKLFLDNRSAQKPTEETGTAIVLTDNRLESTYAPVVINGEIMLNVNFIKDYVDETIFWDGTAEKLTITTADKVIRMKDDDLTYYVNNEPFSLDVPVHTDNGNVYMPSGFAETLYNISCTYSGVSDTVIVDFTENQQKTATVLKKSTVYEEADKSSSKIVKIPKGTTVNAYDEQDEFIKIRTAEGDTGYIYTKNIGEVAVIDGIVTEEKISPPSWTADNGKITMVWDQIFNVGQNSSEAKRTPIDGLDVISPTWFALENGDGDISNIADNGYVDWAHNNGYQVWALFSNSFDAEITHQALSNTDTREKIIKQLLAFVSIYNLDGINIDFESVASADGEYYVQFIREVTPLLKEQGVVVSVDMYVPAPWTAHYGMEEVGKIVDYVAVMAYDEHWGTSPESGSVASKGWVTQYMYTALEKVDKNKLIMGIPFYTRLWEEKEENGEITVSSKAYGMNGGKNLMEENNVTLEWLDDIGQYYGEYESEGSTYKMWLEDQRSLEGRLDTALELDVAGIAGWKRGLESENAWTVINNKIKN